MDTSQFFYRNVIISKTDDKVSLVDIYAPKSNAETLEPWLGLVLMLADGQHTLDELVINLSGKYQGAPPANLEKTIHSVVDRLVEMKFIVLTKEPVKLPYYLSLPIEQLDVEKAKMLLEQDKVNHN